MSRSSGAGGTTDQRQPDARPSWPEIPFSMILGNVDPRECKLHCAVFNQRDNPLDVFARSWDEWVHWNRWRGAQDVFNRRLILSLMDEYREKDIWVFGGLFEVVGRRPTPHSAAYDVELLDHPIQGWVGRLKLRFAPRGRNMRLNLESVIGGIHVAEVLPRPYSGRPFPGHDSIEHGFRDLEVVYSQQRGDWRDALKDMKGVYVLHDRCTGRSYVGSACGDTGIWARWGQYITSGHGGNVDLQEVVAREGIEYVREHFRFALLEYWSMRTPDEHVLRREAYWKRVLLSREFGYNAN